MNRERGTTFILTTHDLADVERLCRRIVLIDRGTLIFDGEVETHARPVRHAPHAGRRTCASRSTDVEIDGRRSRTARRRRRARFRFDRRTMSAEALIRRVAERYCVSDISIEEPELESIIRRIYREGYVAEPERRARARR